MHDALLDCLHSTTRHTGVRSMASRPERQKHFNHSVIIALILVWQALLPLRYYVSDDAFDERFAWRMFSPIRMVQCDCRWTEGEDRQKLKVTGVVHMVWLNLMRRARMDVVEGFADHRCDALRAATPNPELYADMRCVMPDGSVFQPIAPDDNLCEGKP